MTRLFLAALLCAASALACPSVAAQIGYDTLISHRGESVDAPENTLPAYKTAAKRGFGFECDVYLSKDGRVFTFHDRDLKRTTAGANTNKCADVTWAEISKLDVGGWGKWKGSKFSPTRPALLEEVLELARDGRYIYVEVKPGPEIVPYIKKVFAAQRKATPKNTLFISFEKASCKALKAAMPEYKVLWITSSKHWDVAGYPPVTAKDVIKAMRETGADGVDCHFDPTVITKEMVAEVRKAGYEFHVWTVDKLDDTEEAFRRGVQTVTTNCAEAQLKAAEARRAAARSFTFATWNIAHYSCGKTYPSTISAADMPKYKAAYAAFLDRANASIIGICEDSWFCDAASTLTARETIFPRYTGFASEQKRPFDYNSLYWKDAECLSSGRRMFRKTTEPRFYRWARLRICGREVVAVEAHLEWNITIPGHMDDRKDEIRQIIEDFKNEPRVVIGGDFNTSLMLSDGKTEINTPEDYEAFRKAGYAAAHWGTINTWPSDKPTLSIDNIFAKGLWIDGVEVFGDVRLSDHWLMRCRLTFDEPGEPVAAAPARYADCVAKVVGRHAPSVPDHPRLARRERQPRHRGIRQLDELEARSSRQGRPSVGGEVRHESRDRRACSAGRTRRGIRAQYVLRREVCQIFCRHVAKDCAALQGPRGNLRLRSHQRAVPQAHGRAGLRLLEPSAKGGRGRPRGGFQDADNRDFERMGRPGRFRRPQAVGRRRRHLSGSHVRAI